MDWFFDEWVYGPMPSYRLDYQLDRWAQLFRENYRNQACQINSKCGPRLCGFGKGW